MAILEVFTYAIDILRTLSTSTSQRAHPAWGVGKARAFTFLWYLVEDEKLTYGSNMPTINFNVRLRT
ncbi:hypothetical protein GX48_00901 [Paracoccidioides brasiliensis]|nr:hypothetical protein GX48_00901 [Paracoccidioides brasiliensis]